ncbi:MAG: asparagine synthase C-terminal domain-containing protein, partial [Candidatus Eremiobacteraeota bacterium]|nr:asparagine synthase C-terminal domain-containing protein [Candidatus Eremiobacteraeota bacterium]
EVECRTLLPDQILTYVDRLSMAHSVETRSPFLDRRIVDFASTLPGSFKVRPDATKSVLKRAARAILPDEIIDRPKEGFALPMHVWLANQLLPLLRELTDERYMGHGFFDPRAVRLFVEEHASRQFNHAYKLWTLLMFQLWFARYIDGISIDEMVASQAGAGYSSV